MSNFCDLQLLLTSSTEGNENQQVNHSIIRNNNLDRLPIMYGSSTVRIVQQVTSLRPTWRKQQQPSRRYQYPYCTMIVYGVLYVFIILHVLQRTDQLSNCNAFISSSMYKIRHLDVTKNTKKNHKTTISRLFVHHVTSSDIPIVGPYTFDNTTTTTIEFVALHTVCYNNHSSEQLNNNDDDETTNTQQRQRMKDLPNEVRNWVNTTLSQQLQQQSQYRLPPFLVEDWNVLFYDIILLLNLVVSISYWVIHRFDVSYIGIAFNEGCLVSLLWIISGLYNGSFLYTAIDGHNHSPTSINSMINQQGFTDQNIKNKTSTIDIENMNRSNNNGGPLGAGLLAFHTYINTMNLRLIYALIVAILQHRTALSSSSELLIPLEFGYGLILMILWRTLHSTFVPR